jgi:hypothetical protein
MAYRSCSVALPIAIGSLWLMSQPARQEPLLASQSREPVRALEAGVAAHPDDPETTRALGQAYLDAHQPGLAIVLVEGAPQNVGVDVRVEHVYARALIDEGHNREALHAEKCVVESCGVLVDGWTAPPGCDAILLASAMRRVDVLRELLSRGIEDTRAQPEATMVAYRNATREARVALQ